MKIEEINTGGNISSMLLEFIQIADKYGFVVKRIIGSAEFHGYLVEEDSSDFDRIKFIVDSVAMGMRVFTRISPVERSEPVKDEPLTSSMIFNLGDILGGTTSQLDAFIQVPETTLKNGLVVPSFYVGKYACSKSNANSAIVSEQHGPWVNISFNGAKIACTGSGYSLIKESQYLAIAQQIQSQDENWTGGKVGVGSLYQGLHRGNVLEAKNGSFISKDPMERRWHVLANGERIYDFAGNVSSWVFNDMHGDESGITSERFDDEHVSLSTALFPRNDRGMGRYPAASRDFTGFALVRGGYWAMANDAGVFALSSELPDSKYRRIGFRCTRTSY